MIGKRRQTFIDRQVSCSMHAYERVLTLQLMPTTSARVESRFPGGAREWCYLAMFGVDPMWQGKGLGSRIIQHKNKQLKGTPMCVSTQSSRTVSIHDAASFVRRRRVVTDASSPLSPRTELTGRSTSSSATALTCASSTNLSSPGDRPGSNGS